MSDRPLLERFGVAYFERRSRGLPHVEATDEVHVLNPEELRALTWIQRWAIIRGALIGAGSGFASALAEVLATPLLGADPEAASLAESVEYYAVVYGVTIGATVLEITFLYWDALRSVHSLSHAAGLNLFAGEEEEHNEVAAALARAALELPNPAGSIFNIDPLKESNKWVLVAVALFYKLKIGLTNFLMKALLRRAMGRVAVRGLLPFMAVPVTAAWNAVVAFLVMREARIRAMGPSAAKAFADFILEGEALSDGGRLAVLRAVGATIVRTQQLHPNLVAFLREVHRIVGQPPEAPLDDTAAFLSQLAELPQSEQDVTLQILAVGAVLDGRVNRRERLLMTQALDAAGRETSQGPLDELRHMFAHGEPLDRAIVEACAAAPAGPIASPVSS